MRALVVEGDVGLGVVRRADEHERARLLARRHSVERRPRGVRPRDSLGRGEGQVQVLVDDEEEAAVRGQRLDRGDDRVRRALHLLIRRADQRGALLRDAERREDGLETDELELAVVDRERRHAGREVGLVEEGLLQPLRRRAAELEHRLRLAEGDGALAEHALGALGHHPAAVALGDARGRDRLVRRHAVQPRPLCEYRRRVQTPHALVLLARLVDDSDGELVARKDHLRRDDAAVAAVLAGVGEGVPVDEAEQTLVDVDHGERRGVRGEREPLVDLPGEAERLLDLARRRARQVVAVEHVPRQGLREHRLERVR
mmetsp:Transcript_17598/g.54912  ORF Transcript_17598/g.54912 Transcript_17598/m.54912 type:complete len:315 (+) Transcript_17598:701-1645(+)